MSATLSVRGVRRAFGRLLALDGVDLELGSGEILALFGANGAGKTTLLRVAATLLAPESGEVCLQGEPISHRNRHRLRARIGFAGHQTFVYDDLEVAENLWLHARLQGLADPAAAVEAALETFGLAARRRQRAGELSRGFQQRVSLARALLADPAVLLLDEPFSGLDTRGVSLLQDRLRRHRDAGRSTMVCTHDLHVGVALADRIVVLDRGRVVHRGAAADLRGLAPGELTLDRWVDTP